MVLEAVWDCNKRGSMGQDVHVGADQSTGKTPTFFSPW